MPEQKINQYLKEIINTMTEGLMVASTDGTILMVNQAFEKMMGYRPEEIIGHSCAILNCDACARLRSASKNQWCDLFEQGTAIRKRCFYMRKDGSYVHILKNAAILRDEAGQVLGAVETLTDISEIARGMNRSNNSPSWWTPSVTFRAWWGNLPSCNRSLI